jgi:hypothetical protein
MVRQKFDERRERLRVSKVRAEAEAIKAEVATWVREHRESIIQSYNGLAFPYLQDLRDRTIDVAQPLAAILEVAYKDQPTLDAVRRELVEAVAIARSEEGAVTDDHRILQVLLDLARSEDPLVGNASELAQKCSPALGQAPDNIPIAAVLRKYGFEMKSVRNDATATPRYRYSLPLEALVEILSRYGIVAAEASASHGRAEASA